MSQAQSEAKPFWTATELRSVKRKAKDHITEDLKDSLVNQLKYALQTEIKEEIVAEILQQINTNEPATQASQDGECTKCQCTKCQQETLDSSMSTPDGSDSNTIQDDGPQYFYQIHFKHERTKETMLYPEIDGVYKTAAEAEELADRFVRQHWIGVHSHRHHDGLVSWSARGDAYDMHLQRGCVIVKYAMP